MTMCGSFHELGGMTCIRLKGHAGRCWCKWAPIEGSPGRVMRGEWAMDGGFYHCGYYERNIADIDLEGAA